jgi:Cdc6-like AAA superfamily ATPase
MSSKEFDRLIRNLESGEGDGEIKAILSGPVVKIMEESKDRIHQYIFENYISEDRLEDVAKNIAEVREKIIKSIFTNSTFVIRDTHEVEPALDVVSLAKEIVRILENIKSEPGNMTGIFGPWGRGKSYLMKHIWEQLSRSDTGPEYVRVYFQAWRYQDTPACWAYLYQQFSQVYLGSKRGLKNWLRYQKRLLALNVARNGYGKLLIILSSLFLACVGSTWIVPLMNLGDALIRLTAVSLLGYMATQLIPNFRPDYFTKAINLIKEYGAKTSFKSNLGVQAEIQNEFIRLVNVWTKFKKGKKPIKLVLFVDDLDRCREERIIEIIDSLRIILDEEEIKDKLIIISAIDERILLRVVKSKYEKLASEAENIDLVKEYIDKLFIFSVKLGLMTEDQSVDFFEKFTKDDLGLSNIAQGAGTASIPDLTSVSLPSEDEVNNALGDRKAVKEEIKVIGELTIEEREMFKKNLKTIRHATPRKIRILYHRYRFARNLLVVRHRKPNENSYWLQTVNQETFIRLLIFCSQNDIVVAGQRSLAEASQDEHIRIEIEDLLILPDPVNRTEYLKLLDVLELVVAY